MAVGLLLSLCACAGARGQAGSIASLRPGRSGEIAIAGPKGPLAATFLNAGEGAPIVLIIPGSGPTDRDGNNPMGVKGAPYRMLAEALAQRGIGSVRIDKRGMFGSARAIPDPNQVTIADYAADAHHWIDAIREARGVPCVWLLGHSEGGLVALAAAQAPEGICGLLLVAAPGRPIGAVLREQFAAGPAFAEGLSEGLAAVARLEAGERVDGQALPGAFRLIFDARTQDFLIDMLSHDPAQLAAAYRGPMLIVRGARDIQVSAADAAMHHAARPDATLLTVPGMTHVLKRVESDDRAANLATYAAADLPLAPGLADGIAAFVREHAPQ